MSLDRALQYEILTALAAKYPGQIGNPYEIGDDPDATTKNIYYLAEHGLIRAKFSKELSALIQKPYLASITSAGLDFLADDGGLSAILGVVTVKLHEDTLRQLIAAKIEASALPEAEKRPLLQVVRELPGEAIKHLSTKLLDLGLENLPGATALIYTALQSVRGF
ncbi:hypothetical protein [Pseudomonas sp. PS01300]|uniref:hypothetical protein n=1 Tax=Pseudomonas sp. PS01300 TaxID=2991436 RepID=UPI00249AF296|nr:hypothetical protein [Pseudomonas sp. PS01300]